MRSKPRKTLRRVSKQRKTRRQCRKQKGGDGECETYKQRLEIINNAIVKNTILLATGLSFLLNDDLDLETCSKLYAPNLKELVNKQIRLLDNSLVPFVEDNLPTIFPRQMSKISSRFSSFFGFKTMHSCSIDQLMSFKDPKENCNPATHSLVRGSCSIPSFFDKHIHEDMSNETKKKYLEVFDAIEEKLLKESKPQLDLVIGAKGGGINGKTESESYVLFINPNHQGSHSLDSLLDKIRKADSLKGIVSYLKDYFPLSYGASPNNKEVLDKILSMKQKGIEIRLENKMCGSCFPAFYYLVKRGIPYQVSPEQRINKEVNTEDIQKCFKNNY